MASTPSGSPFVIGVTGNIACGKSSVLAMLHDLGAETIDADRLYHGLIASGQPLWALLLAHFGDRILDEHGQIDRRALGSIVFRDPVALAQLDHLTHPSVIEAVTKLINESQAAVVAIDAIKLVESGMSRLCDDVWLVECDPNNQLARLMERNGLDMEDARRRIAAQPSIDGKRAAATVTIDNHGTLAQTRAQVEAAWSRLTILSD